MVIGFCMMSSPERPKPKASFRKDVRCIVWHQSRKGGWFGGQSSNTFEPYVFWHSCRLLTTLSFVPLLSRFCCHCSCTVAHTPWRLTTSRSWPLNVAVVATSRATRRPCEHARVAQLGGSCGQQCADPVGLLCSGYRDSVGFRCIFSAGFVSFPQFWSLGLKSA